MSPGNGKLALIIAKGMPAPGKMKRPGADASSGEGGDEGSPDEERGDDTAGESAMGDLSAALKSGDRAAAWSAFKDAMDICNGADDKGDSKDY